MTDETHETSGKVAILTGAAVGLGRAVVTRFAHEGAAVVAVDTNVQDGRAVIELIRKNGAAESSCVRIFSHKSEQIDLTYPAAN